MDAYQILGKLARQGGGIVSTKRAEAAGISRATLSKLCQQGKLQRIARGQYSFGDSLADELLSFSLRTEQLIFSHETALFLHGMSDRTPFVHSVTVSSSYIPSPSLRSECKVYYIKPELFDLGQITLPTPFGNLVPCYDMERTLCDILRSRNKIGTETLLAALKQYAACREKNLNRLSQYAAKMNLTNLVRQYLEVLL